MRLVVLPAIVAFSILAQTASDPLRSTHDALFGAFIPLEELHQTPEAEKMFLAARDGIWNAASSAPGFEQLVSPFIDLQGFGNMCHMADYLKETRTNAFSALNPIQRRHVLFLLQSCSENGPRRLAMNVRNFYVVKTYEAVQEPLTGVKLNLYAPPDYAAQHLPKLAPTRLAYDRQRKQLFSKDREIDYLIVGSGPAGSVLAHELRRGNKRVLLVERGAFVVPGSMETRLIDDLIDTRTSSDGAIRIRNGMAVGGGSQVNVDLCFAPTLPSIQAKIESWREEGRIGPQDFTKDELAEAYAWVKNSIGTRVLSESEINLNNRALWDGAKLAGLHPKLYDLNTYPPGQSPYPVTDKRSAESELVLGALADPINPLSLLPDAGVRRVLFEENKAVGVEVRMRAPVAKVGVIADPNQLAIPAGETFTIRARNVILSAGALGSPTILLRSGVHNDQIGRGVILHPSMPIMGLFDRNIDVLSGTEASVFVDDKLISEGYALESMADQPLYAALMSPGSAMQAFEMVKEYRRLAGFGVMLVDTPSPENRLTLDADGEPVITYTLSEADKARFRRGVAEAVRIMFLAGAKQVMLPTTENLLSEVPETELKPLVLTDAKQADAVEKRLQFVPNRTIVTSAHMQGTNKIGDVVSRGFKVIGTESLYVVDGSIFPTSIGANPMQSIYTFAKIFADSQ
ncbi:MAG TPA: GMC family oxidoreductase [Bryobacteraceae bacterium]|jgi:choline dehydrogenase-like flavoprotein|nr:GMC family oxidoreductase [Bryobacteraceae bacterium]